MGVGLQVFGANRELLLDTSDRLCRCLGSFVIGREAGSFRIPLRSGKMPWCFIRPDLNNKTYLDPRLVLNGDTISWPRQKHISQWTVIYGEC